MLATAESTDKDPEKVADRQQSKATGGYKKIEHPKERTGYPKEYPKSVWMSRVDIHKFEMEFNGYGFGVQIENPK